MRKGVVTENTTMPTRDQEEPRVSRQRSDSSHNVASMRGHMQGGESALGGRSVERFSKLSVSQRSADISIFQSMDSENEEHLCRCC